MIAIGKFFFKNRNWIFILFYGALFIPSPQLFPVDHSGTNYLFPIIAGLCITMSGQLIRGLTIGLVYIVRGGLAGHPYAEELVTGGIFNHCRNPLYLGNILMLLGVGILANSLIYTVAVVPIFIFIYHAIVLAEENFLLNTFGTVYTAYCKKVNRWLPGLKGFGHTLAGTVFNGRRWLLQEYGTIYIWLTGITGVLFLNYPQLTSFSSGYRNMLMLTLFQALLVLYLLVRYLKKSGKLRE